MSLPDDEKWYTIHPTTVTPWGLTIRKADGSFREPTKEEVDGLLATPRALEISDKIVDAMCVALADALGLLRAFASVYGSDEETDNEIKRLAGILIR